MADNMSDDGTAEITEAQPEPPSAALDHHDQRVADARAWLAEFFSDLGEDCGIRAALHDYSAPPGEPKWEELSPGFMPGILDFRDYTEVPAFLDVLAQALVLEADQGADVFVCPYPHAGPRRKGGAEARCHAHADIDGPLDMNRARFAGAMVVASGGLADDGSPRGHVFCRLTESVPAHVHTALCVALGELVGGEHRDTSKVSDEDVLRPVGTLNHKPEYGPEPRPVTWLIRPDDESVRPWEPAELARELGIAWPVPVSEPEPEPEPEPGPEPPPGLKVPAGYSVPLTAPRPTPENANTNTNTKTENANTNTKTKTKTKTSGNFYSSGYAQLDEASKARVDAYLARTLEGMAADLAASRDWPPSPWKDERGRGWDKLQADVALKLGRLALADWCPLNKAEARAHFLAHAPTDGGWTSAKVAQKWADQWKRAVKKGPLPFPKDRPNDAADSEDEAADGEKDNGGNGNPGRHLKITRASDIPMRATRWLWLESDNYWLPLGELVGLGGREGVGKSTLCADLAAKVTRGKLPGDLYGKPKGVVIVTTEGDWRATIKPRLVAAGADLDRVYQVTAVGADGLEDIVSMPDDLKRLERIIIEYDVALVILDPLLTLVNKKLDTHKDAEVRQALEPLARIGYDTGASIVGLIHVTKATEGDLMNRIMGSRAIGAVARGMLFCSVHKTLGAMASDDFDNSDDDDDDHITIDHRPQPGRSFMFGQIKNNLQATASSSIFYHIQSVGVGYDDEVSKIINGSLLVIDGVIEKNIEDLVLEQEKRAKAKQTQGGKATVWLVAYLAGKGEIPSAQVIKAGEKIGFSRATLSRARKELGDGVIRVRTSGFPKTSTWELISS